MNLDVIDANRRVHSFLILSGEYQKSPHRNIDSINRVRSVLSKLHPSQGPLAHLDVGCGDGFIFECKPANWISHGVDATVEMLRACAENHPDVKLQEGYAEILPFSDASFDVVTCYSFLDHLDSSGSFYAEALRILKPGGVFYFGLNPNREFYSTLKRSDEFKFSDALIKLVDLSLESQKAFDDGTYYEKNFGVDRNDLYQCEPGKSVCNGLSSLEERSKLEELGFKNVQIKYEWVVQQHRLDSATIKALTDFLPFTGACFKYFDLFGIK